MLCQQYYVLVSQVLNVHNMVHIADDVKKFRCTLNDCTAFSFENELGLIRNFLRSDNKPLVQLCQRMIERTLIQEKVTYPKECCILKS